MIPLNLCSSQIRVALSTSSPFGATILYYLLLYYRVLQTTNTMIPANSGPRWAAMRSAVLSPPVCVRGQQYLEVRYLCSTALMSYIYALGAV